MKPELSAATRTCGVIGWPIAHSRSPALHNAAYAALGLDWAYLAFAVPPARLRAAVEGAAALGLVGLNVTIPHKETVLALCAPDELAARVGAVNTLVFADGAVRGHNTDVHGFAELARENGARLDGHIVVVGSGGAARAVVAALDERARITLISRTPRTVTLAGRTLTARAWSASAVADADVVVDCTPRGLDDATAPLDVAPLPASAVVLDLVVRQSTRLVTAARARGLVAAAGATMLLHQGARAFELWTGQSAPIAAMDAALRLYESERAV